MMMMFISRDCRRAGPPPGGQAKQYKKAQRSRKVLGANLVLTLRPLRFYPSYPLRETKNLRYFQTFL